MSVTRQVLKNAGALTAARGVTAVLTLVTMVYLARVLEPGAFGILNWALAYLAYFKLLPDLGLGVYGQREAARDHARVPHLVSHILSLRVLLAVVAFVAYLGVLATLDKSALFKTVVAIQGLALFGFALTLEWTFKGIERMEVLAVRNVIVSVLTLGVTLLLVREPDQVVLAAAATVVGILAGSGWLLLTYRRTIGPLRPRVALPVWRRMLGPALPIALAHFLASINANMDQLMLGLMRTEQEVGWYAAAYRLLLAAMIPAQIILQAFLPSLSAAYGDRSAMAERGRMFATTLFAFGLPVAAGGFLFAPELISLFGERYTPAVPAVLLLMGTAALLYVNMAFGNPLIAWDRQRLYMYALLAGALANIVLNFTLIPPFGLTGAAAATVASEFVVLLGVAAFYYREARHLYFGAFLRSVAATAIAVGGVLSLRALLDVPFFLAATAFCVLYAVLAEALGLVDIRHIVRQGRRSSP